MRIFTSAMGQIDNVGDTVLRRAFLDALRGAGELQVFVGARADSYLSGLGLHDEDRVYRTSAEWRREIARSTLREASVYAFNAGEMELQRAYALRYLRIAPHLALNRLRGGHAVHAGFGVRQKSGWRFPVAATLRLCDLVSWRDAYSRGTMGLGRIAPDWAFATGAADADLLASTPDRPFLAVSVRYNGRRPADAWLEALRGLADSRGLDIVAVSQIERDGPLAEELAAKVGGTALVWDSPDHFAQEQKLRGIYQRSLLVVSDRLHAAVIGLTEGALPLVIADAGPSKAARTLDAVGIKGTTIGWTLPDPAALERRANDVVSRREPILRHVVEARAALHELTGSIRKLTA
ncbi:polysaccharide pyruvyl transferase family protein [Cryobacterium sp. Hz9]|uniref:polysaccharide pyruvyl transferase family protein n=1 Tax=Cryobacterium sp. Hz9 TaxID=1259167 RepID=UPI00106BEA5A|nr:polysaccharide pyruvyl transferase family protein [Cryobacterium sp. Hz9]TFB68593.1 polysaccharide pyruvyl transferase family protein [Cryobacterium sp. Hz9]